MSCLVQLLDVCDYPKVMFLFKSSISGFLIVAACVMTFEARDSATKIAPTASAMQKDQVGPDTLANLFLISCFLLVLFYAEYQASQSWKITTIPPFVIFIQKCYSALKSSMSLYAYFNETLCSF